MGEELEVPQNFEERMKARIKDSIGDMITDEELGEIVKRSMEDIFFKGKTVKDGYYNTKETPPFLHEMIKELLTDKIQKKIKAYINDNKEEVGKAIETVFREGMAKALITSISNIFQNDLSNLEHNIANRIQQGI